MNNRILGHIAAGWLGLSLALFADVNFKMWEFWVIIIPVIFLYNFSYNE